MKSVKPLLPSDFPEDGLRFFHGLSNWIEQYKGTKPHLTNWKHGMKALTKLSCVKPKKGEPSKSPRIWAKILYTFQHPLMAILF